jgi:phage-related protein
VAEETVIIRFTGDASSVESAADQASKAVGGLESTAKTAGKGFDVLGEIATGAMRRIGEAAINAVGTGLSMIGNVIGDSIKEATEFQNVFAQTQAVIESTGMAAGFTAEEMAGLASDLSAASGMSLFSDDAILGATNVLATFKEIKGVQFEDATSAILDMSQAMGMDLQSATVQVGKALNDPIGGISALSRVGVQFTEDQKAMIEEMVALGDVAGAQELILGELNSQFGGSAAAAVNTYAGQMKVLEEQFNDVKQGIGEALLPILQELGRFAVQYVVPAVEKMATAFTTWLNSVDWVGLMSLFETIFETISNAITSVDWDGIFASISTAIETVMTTFQTLRAVFYEVLGAITTQIDVFWGIVEPVWNQLVAVFEEAWTQLEPLGAVLEDAFGGIEEQSTAMAPIGEILGNIVTAILNVVGVIVKILVPIIQVVFPIFVNYVKSLVENFMSLYNTINYVFSGQLSRDIQTWWDDTITKITTSITTVIDKAKQMGKDIMHGVIDGVNEMSQKLKDAFGSVVGGAITWLKNLLGIASPSKLFADVIGRPIGQGIAAGIVASSPSIAGALGGTIGAATAATQQTVQNFYLTANYATAQSQSDIMTDVRTMQLLAGGV